MEIDKVLYNGERAYILRRRKSGKRKGEMVKDYGKIIRCSCCKKKCFVMDLQIKKGKGKFCSKKCATSKQNHPRWKKGRRIHDGYIVVFSPAHPFAGKDLCVPEHRLVMEKHLGRYLKPEEIVHHKNGAKTDNRIENLMLFANDYEHRKFHKNAM